MTKPLVSTAQMSRLRGTMGSMFSTKATILRSPDDADETSDAQTGKPEEVGTVYGWLSSRPTPEGTVDSGAFVTVNTYRWTCPVGTDIRPRDFLDIGESRYVVTDTTSDDTVAVALSVSLRLRE